jgi:hypothetical protein
MKTEHNLNIQDFSALDRESVQKTEITTFFAPNWKQLRYVYKYF